MHGGVAYRHHFDDLRYVSADIGTQVTDQIVERSYRQLLQTFTLDR